MSDLFWLTDEQVERLRPFSPKSHGTPRVDDRRVLSSIVFVNRNGLRWRDAPSAYGPHKTLHNSWKRWGEKYADFQQITRSRSRASAIVSHADLRSASLEFIRSVLPTAKAIRLVGVTVSNFENAAPSSAQELFEPVADVPAAMATS